MGKYFGTDGIRGRVGGSLMNPEFAYRLGATLGAQLAEAKLEAPLNVVIGRDTRASGPVLVDALTQGLNCSGVYVHDLGIVPTPAIAQAVLEQQADLGIAVTASHNPATDNGIKLFNQHGHKLSVAAEEAIERAVDAQGPVPADLPIPKSYPLDGAAHYINYQSSLLDQNCMAGWRIVLDLSNGATCETTPAVFKRWGAELILIGDNPDGENINRGVGSECPAGLSEAVRAHKAHLGVAHDGDGDRLVVCDETGTIVDGDILLAIFGVYAMRAGALRENTLVATIQSNLALDHALREAGGGVVRVDVGDRNVASKMRELGANIGGESSGHIIFSDFSTTGDGLLAALKLTDLMCQTGKPLSALRQEFSLFPQRSANLKVEAKRPLEALEQVQATIQELEAQFGDTGRVLVRYSGTEPKIRLLIEGQDIALVDAGMQQLERAVHADLSVIGS